MMFSYHSNWPSIQEDGPKVFSTVNVALLRFSEFGGEIEKMIKRRSFQ
jgi:hypothetical protein